MLKDWESLPLDQRATMAAAHDRLAAEFENLRSETIVDVLQASHSALGAHATVTHHLPLLSERFARQALSTLSVVKSAPEGVHTVVFIDHHDAGRAKIAKQLLLVQARPGSVVVATAGTEPLEAVDEETKRAMAEAGLSAGTSFPKPLTGTWLTYADTVVVLRTSGMPELPEDVTYEHWDVAGPRSAQPQDYGQVLEALRPLVADLVQRLGLGENT